MAETLLSSRLRTLSMPGGILRLLCLPPYSETAAGILRVLGVTLL